MTRNRALGALALGLLSATLAACTDERATSPEGRDAFERYVALGTSVSAGTQSDGIYYATQSQSWTNQLARAAFAHFDMPFIAAPGCNAPIIAPVALAIRLDKTSAASTPNTCANNLAGVTLPENNVAIDGALVYEMLVATPETASTRTPKLSRANGEFFKRVLPAGKSQVGAMMGMSPTFVSIEVGANDIARARGGLVSIGDIGKNPTLFTVSDTVSFRTYYDMVIDSVKKTGARAVLVGLPTSLASIPGMRTGAEIASQAAALGQLGVVVQADCAGANAQNLMFVTIRVIGAIIAAQQTGTAQPLSCQNAGGTTVDYVLTPAEVQAVNTIGTAINNLIQDRATKNGYAFFSLGALYDAPDAKPAFNASALLTSSTPYGPYVSLDGFHPNGAGQVLLAKAAAAAIDAKYGFDIASSFNP